MQIPGQPNSGRRKSPFDPPLPRHPIRNTARVMGLAQAWLSFALRPYTLTAALDLIPFKLRYAGWW